MKPFITILQNIAKKFSQKTTIIYFAQIESAQTVQTKYRAYKSLINNIFLDTETKHQIQTVFETTQKHYFVLNRFSKHIHYNRHRHRHQHKITTDLSSTPLDPKHKHTFIIYENTTNSYLFSIHDLIHIIQTAITNAPNFFEDPIHPKNPYTNIPLTTTTLQAFFYKLHKIYYPTPPILENYYKCQYNLDLFKLENQMEIRDIAIKNFVTKSPTKVLYEEILEMIDDYFVGDPQTTIKIDKQFPIHQLIQIMRPYLYVLLMSEYHIHGSEKRTRAQRVFKKAKRIFMNYNPRFGERIPDDTKTTPRPKYRKRTPKRTPKPRTHQGSREPAPQPQQSPQMFIFTLSQPPQPTPQPIFIFGQQPQTPSQIPKYFEEHPKFSMKDIDIYLQDPSVLKPLEPIRPPRPRYISFDTEDENSDIESYYDP